MNRRSSPRAAHTDVGGKGVDVVRQARRTAGGGQRSRYAQFYQSKRAEVDEQLRAARERPARQLQEAARAAREETARQVEEAARAAREEATQAARKDTARQVEEATRAAREEATQAMLEIARMRAEIARLKAA